MSIFSKKSSVAILVTSLLCIPSISFSEDSESNQFSYEEITSPSTFDEVEQMGVGASELKAASSAFCYCVTYIKNRYNLSCSANAKDMGSCLVSSKFKKLSSPLSGAVIIFQPGYGGGINTQYGHIGVITKTSYNSKNKSYTLTVRGANQGGGTWTEYNCNNVSELSTTYTVGSSRDKNLSFYAK